MFTTEAVEDYADALAPLLPMDDAAHLPGDRAAPRRSRPRSRWPAPTTWRRARTAVRRSSRDGRSYHGNTLGALDALGQGAAPQALHARGSDGSCTRRAAYEYRCENPRHPGRLRRLARRRARADDRVLRARTRSPRSSPSRSPGPRSRRAVPCDDYWPNGRRGLPSLRRPRDRRRGDDRVRPDRTVVRRRSLGRPTRHRHRRQGHDERLRAVRVRGVRAARSSTTIAPRGFVHGFTWSHNALGAAVGPGDARAARATRTWSIGAREAGRGPSRTRSPIALDDVPIGRRRARARHDARRRARRRPGDEGAVPAPRTGDRAGAGGRAGRRTAPLLLHRARRRRRTATW